MALSTTDNTTRKHLKIKRITNDSERKRRATVARKEQQKAEEAKKTIQQIRAERAEAYQAGLCPEVSRPCIDEPFHSACYLCLIADGSHELGYAFFFENLVVYSDRINWCFPEDPPEGFEAGIPQVLMGFVAGKKKLGAFLGIVRCVVPRDPYRVTYEWIKHTEGFKHREKQRRQLSKMGLSMRKMRKMKQRGQLELSKL